MHVLVSGKNEEVPIKMRSNGQNISPILRIWGFFRRSRAAKGSSPWSDLSEFKTHPRFYDCPCYLHKNEEDPIKTKMKLLEC